MARIRSTHPGQWTAGDFLECTPLARLLALALRNIADDHGVFRWKPTTLKAECLPADNCDITDLLEELVRNDQITKYDVDGKTYGIIKDFTQWQRPKKPKYTHPVPDWFSTSSEPVSVDDDTGSEIPPQREEVGGKRKEDKKENTRLVAPAQPRANAAFERFKAAFPMRGGSNPWVPAEKKFNALVKTGVDPETLIAAAAQLARDEAQRGNIGTKFIPQAITWLNQQRFSDFAVESFSSGEPAKIDWDAQCARFKQGFPWSTKWYGPEPGALGCRVPREVLAKHDLLPLESRGPQIPQMQSMQH